MKTTAPVVIASYVRVSSEEQRQRQTIQTQRAEIARHCSASKVSCVEFADDGVSGTIPFSVRPSSSALMQQATEGKIRELLVYRFDRLGRDTIDTLSTLSELLKHGVKVVSMKEGIAENNAQGRLKTGIHSLFAAYERDSIIERSVDATRRLAQDGVWLGGIVPYGYIKSGAGKDARLELSTERIPGHGKLSEAGVMEIVYRKAADGKSCRAISDYLNQRGIPPVSRGADALSKRKKRPATRWTPGRIRNLNREQDLQRHSRMGQAGEGT